MLGKTNKNNPEASEIYSLFLETFLNLAISKKKVIIYPSITKDATSPSLCTRFI
jgi:hypothetical protein